ncbi:MAG: type II secretion system protein [Burkholderiales bacterium]
MSTRLGRENCGGVTLVELIVFIVIVGVAMAGLFAAFNTITAASADPQVRKQVLAIAESLMDEVSLMPFTFCDPDDPAAPTASGTGDCATVEGLGAEGAETRYSTTLRFDNVSDYHGFAMTSGIQNFGNTTVPGLGAYSASIGITLAGSDLGLGVPANAEALRISVTVTGPGSISTTLEGYRTRYAPNALP